MAIVEEERETARTTGPTDSLTRFVAEVGRAVSFDALPAEVIQRAKHCVLDWLGVTLLGSLTPQAEIVRDVLLSSQGRGPSTVFGGDFRRVGPVDAALMNGTATHALDFDDGIGTGGLSHSSASIVTASFAMAEATQASGRAMLEAIVAAQESGVRVAALMGREHYHKGFHEMATLGIFSATTAAARLLQLDLDQWLMALGIAGSEAAGLKANFGTMTKPLHAGRSASGGVFASLLASKGFTAAPDILEAKNGFAWTQAPVPHFDAAFRPLGRPFVVEGIRFKYHASCAGTHSPIDATKQLLKENGIDEAAVQQVIVHVNPHALDVCNIYPPKTALEAKFSLRFTTAAALLGWDTTETGFSDELAVDPIMQKTMERIAVDGSDPGIDEGTAEIELILADQRNVSKRHRFGDDRLNLSDEWETLVEKFTRVTSKTLNAKLATHVVEQIAALDELQSVAALTAEIAEGATRPTSSI